MLCWIIRLCNGIVFVISICKFMPSFLQKLNLICLQSCYLIKEVCEKLCLRLRSSPCMCNAPSITCESYVCACVECIDIYLKSIVWQFIVFGGKVLDICRKKKQKVPWKERCGTYEEKAK